MACPFFDPLERLDDRIWTRPPRLSLGDPYAGVCHADATSPYSPDLQQLVSWCNPGHARRECPRFPRGPAPDAAHFIVARDEGGLVEIKFAVERDHRPFAHGAMRYKADGATADTNEEMPWIGRQAAAYLRSYLRRRVAP